MNLNIVDLFRNVLRYVAPSVPVELRGETIRRLLLGNGMLRRIFSNLCW